MSGISIVRGQPLRIHQGVPLLLFEVPEPVACIAEYYSHSQSLTTHSEHMFMNLDWFLTFINQKTNKYSLFSMNMNLYHFTIKCGGANC